MRISRTAAGATVAIAALTTGTLVAGPAAADPTGAKKGEVFTAQCQDLGTVELATNGSSIWPSSHLTAGHGVLVPYALHLEITPTGGQTQVVEIGKPGPEHATTDECSFTATDSNSTVNGIAYVAVRPR